MGRDEAKRLQVEVVLEHQIRLVVYLQVDEDVQIVAWPLASRKKTKQGKDGRLAEFVLLRHLRNRGHFWNTPWGQGRSEGGSKGR